MLQRIRDIAAAVIFGAATIASWASADQDPAWELHVLIDTNTEDSFTAAKRVLFNQIDNLPGNRIDCRYSGTSVDLQMHQGRLRPDPAAGVQVEHTWASSARWADDDVHFPRDSVEGVDLHNLFAVRRGINGSRGNHQFGEPTQEVRELRIDPDGTLNHDGGGTPSGSLRGKDDNGTTVFEPRDDHKGNVARAMFYMSVRYWWSIPDDMEDVLKQWHEDDPVDAEERARNVRIHSAQGNRNPFVDEPELVGEIGDF